MCCWSWGNNISSEAEEKRAAKEAAAQKAEEEKRAAEAEEKRAAEEAAAQKAEEEKRAAEAEEIHAAEEAAAKKAQEDHLAGEADEERTSRKRSVDDAATGEEADLETPTTGTGEPLKKKKKGESAGKHIFLGVFFLICPSQYGKKIGSNFPGLQGDINVCNCPPQLSCIYFHRGCPPPHWGLTLIGAIYWHRCSKFINLFPCFCHKDVF